MRPQMQNRLARDRRDTGKERMAPLTCAPAIKPCLTASASCIARPQTRGQRKPPQQCQAQHDTTTSDSTTKPRQTQHASPENGGWRHHKYIQTTSTLPKSGPKRAGKTPPLHTRDAPRRAKRRNHCPELKSRPLTTSLTPESRPPRHHCHCLGQKQLHPSTTTRTLASRHSNTTGAPPRKGARPSHETSLANLH